MVSNHGHLNAWRIPVVFTQLNLLYRIRKGKFSILITRVSRLSAFMASTILPYMPLLKTFLLLVVVTNPFAKCSATENKGAINEEIVWYYGQCLQISISYVTSDLLSSSFAPNNVIIIEKFNKNWMILFFWKTWKVSVIHRFPQILFHACCKRSNISRIEIRIFRWVYYMYMKLSFRINA